MKRHDVYVMRRKMLAYPKKRSWGKGGQSLLQPSRDQRRNGRWDLGEIGGVLIDLKARKEVRY